MSGDCELHTTPWSSCKCLFDDEKRAIEFKEKFQRSETSLMQITELSAHLEEKCSGEVDTHSSAVLVVQCVTKQNRCSLDQVKCFFVS